VGAGIECAVGWSAANAAARALKRLGQPAGVTRLAGDRRCRDMRGSARATLEAAGDEKAVLVDEGVAAMDEAVGVDPVGVGHAGDSSRSDQGEGGEDEQLAAADHGAIIRR
jgi:hypothetical protein